MLEFLRILLEFSEILLEFPKIFLEFPENFKLSTVQCKTALQIIYGFIVLSLSAIVFQVKIYGKKSIY